MAKQSTIPQVHVVFGFMNTGSGSLTFPEDFNFKGFFVDMEDAQAEVKRLNDEEEVPRSCRLDEDEGSIDDEEDEGDDYDGMIYTFETVKNLSKK